MLSVFVVLVFYVVVAILAGHGILRPRLGTVRIHKVPLNYTSYTFSSKMSTPVSGGFFTAPFTIGRSQNLSLVISTSSCDILLRPNLYHPSGQAEDLFYDDHAAFSVDGNLSMSTVAFEAMSDLAGSDGLMVPGTPFANMPLSLISTRDVDDYLDNVLPGNTSGMIGLLPGQSIVSNGSSWMGMVAADKRVPSNRFGLMLQVRGTAGFNAQAGEMRIGGFDADSIDSGQLVTAALIDPSGSTVSGDVIVGEMFVAQKQELVFASGTEGFLGPWDLVNLMFNSTGITSIEQDGRLRGLYPCESAPEIGLAFPSSGSAGGYEKENCFFIDASALGRNIGNGTCMSIIEGVDNTGQGVLLQKRWTVGHAFMQGKYIDYNMDEQSIGIGMLKNQNLD